MTTRLHGESMVQFSSVVQSCLTLCDPVDCSTPGFLVHHQLSELAQNRLSSEAAIPFCIPTRSEWESLLLCLLVSMRSESWHSNKYILARLSHCGFELHFSDDIWCRVLFHILICHLYSFFGEVSVQVSDPFSNRVLFLLLSFKSSFYVLDNSPFSETPFAGIFFSVCGLSYHSLEN